MLSLLLLACQADPEPTEDTPTADSSECDSHGLPNLDWQSGGGTTLGAAARDLTLSTTAGEVSLAQLWTGCDSMLFLPDVPAQDGNNLWTQKDLNALFAGLPPNAVVFFTSTEAGATGDDRRAKLEGQLEKATEGFSGGVYVLTQRADRLPGWLGDLFERYGFGFGIDPSQRIRFIGSFADIDRYNSTESWWDGNIKYAALEAQHWNFEAERQARLDGEDAVIIEVFDGEVIEDPEWAGKRGSATVELGSAADIAAFDTLELDLSLECVGEGEFGDCPAWDYLAKLYLCDADSCSTEIGRWITTYHREGRWVHDISPLLPLLEEGGERTLEFYTQQPYEVHLDLRFSTRGTVRPQSSELLFQGGPLNETFLEDHPPVEVEIPADAAVVELVTVVTGHGGVGDENCAEFCAIENVIDIDGTKLRIEYPEAGTSKGCEEDVGAGTVPNQYGTWWLGRNGWCPGREVTMERHDITTSVTPGQPATFRYETFLAGEPYVGDGARIDAEIWLVVSNSRHGDGL